MGTYQKMKQAEAEYKELENDISTDEKSKMYWSSREKYRTLKYEYTIQSSILILVAFTVIAVLASYLFGGV
mgnify:CR=1 FL=1